MQNMGELIWNYPSFIYVFINIFTELLVITFILVYLIMPAQF